MNFLRNLVLAAVAAVGLASPAAAGSQVLCSGEVAVGTLARSIGGSSSSVPSKTLYQLNGQGCAVIQQADIGYFISQGFSPGADSGTIVFSTGVQTGTTDIPIGLLPAGAYLSEIVAVNTTANAVTGNISIGSTANGTDIVASLACGANCVADAPGTTTLAKNVFSITAATTLHAAAITSWNSANVTFTVVYRYF